jgi:hypothetical protein
VVPQANSVSEILKGDAASYASNGATDNSNHQFEVVAGYDTTNASSSQTVIALGNTSNKVATVTLSSANGNVQTVQRTAVVVTATPLGGSSHNKANPDNIGTVTFTANAAGPAALNSVKVTLTGLVATSTLSAATSSVSLMDSNGNNVNTSDGATESTSSVTGGFAVTWTFGSASSGFQLSAGTPYTFTLRANTTLVAGISNTAESLSATVQGATDVQYTDGLDGSATTSIGLPTAVVPITINSIVYPVGQ